jgi:hypothetical protein
MQCEACLQAEAVNFNTCYKARLVCVIFLQYSYKCVQARKLMSGNQRVTALSLAAKVSVVAEKRRTRCAFKRPFPHLGNALYINIFLARMTDTMGHSIVE